MTEERRNGIDYAYVKKQKGRKEGRKEYAFLYKIHLFKYEMRKKN